MGRWSEDMRTLERYTWVREKVLKRTNDVPLLLA
jgi:hypothetical protein